MALRVNGTTLPETGSCKFNGSDVKKIVYNGTTVWQKLTAVQTVSITTSLTMGSTTPSGTRTLTIGMQTPQTGTSAGEAVKGDLKATVNYSVDSSVKTASLTIAEGGWTAGASGGSIPNSSYVTLNSVAFYNGDGYHLGTFTVGQSATGGTITATHSVTILEYA